MSPMARIFTFAASFAIAAQGLRLVLHQSLSAFSGDMRFVLGVLAGVGLASLAGALCALPLYHGTSRWRALAATGLAALAFLGYAAASHYHAVFNRLPTGHRILQITQPGGLKHSLLANAPVLQVLAEVVLPCIVLWIFIRWFGPRTEAAVGRRGARIAVALPWTVLLAVNLIAVMAGTGSFRQGAQSPFAVALRNWQPEEPLGAADESERPNTPAIGESLVQVVQTRLAVPAPEPDDRTYPYCRRDDEGAVDGLRPRNVIILILESVGMRELELPAMNNLRAIAADGTLFERFFASGAQSSQGTVSIFSGIPAATHRRLLLRTPLRRLDGFASDLRSRGFRTAYFHGSDLSFEQQRTYLRTVGFEELYEPDLARDQRIGWGLPDGVMLDRLRGWLEEQKAPALAALFTVSTHDPYELPQGAPSARGADAWSKFVASLEYLDEELGRFYRWYAEHEYPKGTLLFITGDHMPRLPHPNDPPQTSTGELEYRFRVPLIAVGRGIEREVRSELGGHLDVGPTVLGSLGWDRRGCYQGRNLLSEPVTGRWIPSVAGEEMNFLFIHDGDERWTVDFMEGTLRRFNWRDDPQFERALPIAAKSGRVSAVRGFAQAYLQLGGYLNGLDRYVTPSAVVAVKPPQRKAVRPSASPILVSHRGNTQGPEHPDAPRENTQAAIQAAIDAGMEWVEIDMQVTREGIVVLAHDPVVEGAPIASMSLAELRSRDPSASTLEEVLRRFGSQVGFCLEIKPQQFLEKLSIVQGVIKLLPLAKRGAIVDSFSRAAVEAMQRHSDVETGFDLPQRTPRDEWLVYASERGFDWVYVRHDFITPAFIDRAHELGLRVMAYTINDGAKPANVDGIITDVARP